MMSWRPGLARFLAGRRRAFFSPAVAPLAARFCGSLPLRYARRRLGLGSSRLPVRAGGVWCDHWREGVNSGPLAASAACFFLFTATITATPPILTRARMCFFRFLPVFFPFFARVFSVFCPCFFAPTRVLDSCCAGVFFVFGVRPVAVPVAANRY
jgi:hypothetical protein